MIPPILCNSYYAQFNDKRVIHFSMTRLFV